MKLRAGLFVTILMSLMFLSARPTYAGVVSDAPSVSHVLTNVLFWLFGVVGVFAILSLLVSGALYYTSGGDDHQTETAKKAAQFAMIGIGIVLGSLVIMRQIAALLN